MSVDAELEKDRFKGLEMRELNHTEKFTSHVLQYEGFSMVEEYNYDFWLSI